MTKAFIHRAHHLAADLVSTQDSLDVAGDGADVDSAVSGGSDPAPASVLPPPSDAISLDSTSSMASGRTEPSAFAAVVPPVAWATDLPAPMPQAPVSVAQTTTIQVPQPMVVTTPTVQVAKTSVVSASAAAPVVVASAPPVSTTAAIVGPASTGTIYDGVGTSFDATPAQVRTALAANNLDVDGTGIKVGVISNSFDNRGEAASDEQNGQLPSSSRINILSDEPFTAGSPDDDEGRAMMQIVHDVAPGASLDFAAVGGTSQDYQNGVENTDQVFANAILALANDGCKIICDDILDSDSSWFQSTVVDQAIQTVEQEGVTYLIAAGNGRAAATSSSTTVSDPAYQSAWQKTSLSLKFRVQGGGLQTTTYSDALDFGGGSGVQTITIGPNSKAQVQMQWSQPWGNAASNIAFIVSQNGIVVNTGTIGQDAVFMRSNNPTYSGETTDFKKDPYVDESLAPYITSLSNTTATAVQYQVSIVNLSGPDPALVKYKLFLNQQGDQISITGANAGTATGHGQSPYAITVGAVGAGNTPGNTPTTTVPLSEPFSSSDTGDEWLYDSSGNLLPTPEPLTTIAVSGVDDIGTTDSGIPDFFGTSAATPSVAGVAALMIQGNSALNPFDIKNLLEDSAIPMANTAIAGAGLVQANLAVSSAETGDIVAQGNNATLLGTHLDDTFVGKGGTNTYYGLLGTNTVAYTAATAGVTASIATQSATNNGFGGTDTFSNIQDLTGSDHDDSLTGDSGNNVISGGSGNDTITGGDGNDTLYGGTRDYIDNGGFETVVGATVAANGYADYPSIVGGWFYTSGPGIELFTAASGQTPFDGQYGVDLEGAPGPSVTNISLSQNVAGLTAGKKYYIAFDISKILASASASVQVYFGGQLISTLTPTTAWTTYRATVTGGTGTGGLKDRLTFTEVGNQDGNGTLLDSVRMYSTDAADPFLDGNDTFFPGAGADTVQGNGGNDVATFNDSTQEETAPFDDAFDGGAGTDKLVMDWSFANGPITFGALNTLNSPEIGLSSYYLEGSHYLYFKNVELFDLTGGAGNDELVGGSGNDRLIGNGGDDLLIAGGGIDYIDGGAGNDRLVLDSTQASGSHIVLAQTETAAGLTLANGTVLKSIEEVTLAAGDGDDYLDVRGPLSYGAVTNTDFSGLGGNDTLAVDLAHSHNARYDGGTGTDLLILDWSAETTGMSFQNLHSGGPFVGQKSYSYTAPLITSNGTVSNYYEVDFINVEQLQITTGSGNDSITTLGGDDTVTVNGGLDNIDMGAGKDLLIVDYHADTNNISASFGDGNAAAGWSGSITDNIATSVNFTGVETFNLTTGSGDDTVTFGDEVDTISTGAGNDFISSGKGADIINAGTGDNGWSADKSDVTTNISLNLVTEVYSGPGTAKGFDYVGTFSSGSGNDTIVTTSAARNETINTNAGNDTVTVAGGLDNVDLGAGTDTLIVDYHTDTNAITASFDGGSASAGWSGAITDNIATSVSFAGVEKFVLTTGSGDDTVTFGDEVDTISTGAGNDFIDSGKGADIIDAGTGDNGWSADKSDVTTNISLNLVTEVYSGPGTAKGFDYVGTFSSGSGNDTIVTTSAARNETINTNAGNDTVTVAGGLDNVNLGAGTDTLIADYHTDTNAITANFNAGSAPAGWSGTITDNIATSVSFAGVETFVLTTGSGDDNVTFGDEVDTISTGAGNDFIDSGKGADIIDAGTGDNGWSADKSDVTSNITLNLVTEVYSGPGTAKGFDYVGTFSSGSGNDTIVTTSADRNETINTDAGNDTVTVAGGVDNVNLGAGTDTLIADYHTDANAITANFNAGSAVAGWSGTITDNIATSVSFAGVETFVLTTGSGDDNVAFGDEADTISTGAGNDFIDSGKGADIIDAGTGDNGWSADKSDVTSNITLNLVTEVYSGPGTAKGFDYVGTFSSGSGNDTIVTTSADRNETINTNAGNDTVTVAGGVDNVNLGAGTDTLVVDYHTDTNAISSSFSGGSFAAGYTGNVTDNIAVSVSFAGAEAFSITTGSGADTITTGLGNDVISTGAGADTIDGGGGVDIMTGGSGDDTYYVENSADQVIEAKGGGADTVLASVSYALGAGQEIETLETNDANGATAINLTGNEFANTIIGNAGANIINGGAGADTMSGGAGNDIYYVDNAGDKVIEAIGGGTDTVLTSVSYTLGAGQEIEALKTTNVAATLAINLTGNEFANTIIGNAGANIINGGAGADTMAGGAGNDTYYVDNAGDKIIEAANGGTDTVLTSVSYTLGVNQEIEALETTSAAATLAINLTGNEFANTIIGNAGANIINGGAGADTMSGGGGNDTYYVDNAGDKVIEAANGGTDTVLTSVSYTLGAGQQIETLKTTNAGGTGAINLTGNEFANTIIGNAGVNIINGGAGADTMSGGAGNDTYYVDNAGDKVIEAANGGTDAVLTSVSYTLGAGQQIETLATTNAAGTGAINLTGNTFGNTVTGNAGNNVIDGEGGIDILTGGAGSDTFMFDSAFSASNIDRITDFATSTSSVHDIIALGHALFSALTVGALSSTAFMNIGTGTETAADHILYNHSTGGLFYDADGSGSAKAVQFATLDTKPAITNVDFRVV